VKKTVTTKPNITLTQQEAAEVKKVARSLLEKLPQLPHIRASASFLEVVCGHSGGAGNGSALCFQRGIFRPSLSWVEKPV